MSPACGFILRKACGNTHFDFGQRLYFSLAKTSAMSKFDKSHMDENSSLGLRHLPHCTCTSIRVQSAKLADKENSCIHQSAFTVASGPFHLPTLPTGTRLVDLEHTIGR